MEGELLRAADFNHVLRARLRDLIENQLQYDELYCHTVKCPKCKKEIEVALDEHELADAHYETLDGVLEELVVLTIQELELHGYRRPSTDL